MVQQVVHLYVFDTLSDWEFGYAAAGINNPAFQACPGQYRIQTVAVRREPVTTMGGLRVLPDLVLSDLEPSISAMLIWLRGYRWRRFAGPPPGLPAADCWMSGAIRATPRAICKAPATGGPHFTSRVRP